MASAFGHGFAAIMLSLAASPGRVPRKFWILAIVCSILPDADALGHALGVPYESMWGHRGITHSILFAVVIGIVVPRAFFPELPTRMRRWYQAFFFLVTLTHPMLDALTTGGLGAAFFAPFENSRYFFPWRPIKVSPINVAAFFNLRGLRVLSSEAVWIGIPFTLLWISSRWIRRYFVRRTPTPLR